MKLPITTYESIGMNNSDFFRSETAVDFANELLELGIESDEIFNLSSLNWKNDSSEIREYLNSVLTQLGINENLIINNIDYIATTLVKKLILLIDVDTCLSRLKEYWQHKESNNLNDFFLLYWARVSWKNNDENKMCYIENYRPETEIEIIENFCSDWLAKFSVENEVVEYFKCDPNILSNENETIDNNFFNRLVKFEETLNNLTSIEENVIPIYRCVKEINESIQNKWLNRRIVKSLIKKLNETVRNQKGYFTTSWKDYILHLRHLAFIYGLVYGLNENFELIENKNAYA
jgi:hypothetical protein